MKIQAVVPARVELLEASAWYQQIGDGLDERFEQEVNRCVSRIANHPELYAMRMGDYRRINLRKFPYYIPFVVRDQTLWILAVAHVRRRPRYWISRVDLIE